MKPIQKLILTVSILLLMAPSIAAASTSDLVFVGEQNLRVTIDGKHYGSFTSKRVEAVGIPAGTHKVVIKSFNPKFLRRKTEYNGTLNVPAGQQVRYQVAAGLKKIGSSALVQATPAQADAANAPVKSFGDGPSIVHINTDKFMTRVLVDGAQVVQEGDCSTPTACDVFDVAKGPHEFDIRSGLTGKKVLYKGRVYIPGGAEVWAKVRGGRFEIYNTQPRHNAAVVAVVNDGGGVTTTTTTTVVRGAPAGISAHMSVIDPDTGEEISVSAGISGMPGMGGVTVTETTTTMTETSGGTVRVVSGNGSIELTSTDGESFTVFIDGKERGTCNCMDGQSIKVRRIEAGEHKFVIKASIIKVRHKFLAHSDKATRLNPTTLPRVLFRDIDETLDLLAAVLNGYSLARRDCTVGFRDTDFEQGGPQSLLSALKRSVAYKKEVASWWLPPTHRPRPTKQSE